ncbi:hypothetical protein HGM15179_014356, partial [Zosterops borbonicus]
HREELVRDVKTGSNHEMLESLKRRGRYQNKITINLDFRRTELWSAEESVFTGEIPWQSCREERLRKGLVFKDQLL